jgi:hypothetical protein
MFTSFSSKQFYCKSQNASSKRNRKTQSQIAEQIAKRNRKVNHERIRENAWVKNFGYQRDPLQNCFLLSIL